MKTWIESYIDSVERALVKVPRLEPLFEAFMDIIFGLSVLIGFFLLVLITLPLHLGLAIWGAFLVKDSTSKKPRSIETVRGLSRDL